MSAERNAILAARNTESPAQSQTLQVQENTMTPEEEADTRLMACNIQRFYDYVRPNKHPMRRYFTHYEINLARFLEPTCSLVTDMQSWPPTWRENSHDLVRDLAAFCLKAKQLLQHWTCSVAFQIHILDGSTLGDTFKPEERELAAELMAHRSIDMTQVEFWPISWKDKHVYENTLSKFRFLGGDMMQEIKGGPTMEKPGHEWTRMEGFDVLNRMIKEEEDPDDEWEEEDHWDDEIIPFDPY
ncbi:hypothetical protein IL306_008465 [Fusarium sp. DS 682]|nr:hypothetical protein IL306_008465 [Fusarium sp. DS 682]